MLIDTSPGVNRMRWIFRTLFLWPTLCGYVVTPSAYADQLINEVGIGKTLTVTEQSPLHGANPAINASPNAAKMFVDGGVNFTPQRVFNIADFGAAGNGTTDDQAALNNALTACASAGGGQVVLNANGRYLVDTVGLTVPPQCTMYCPTPLLGNSNPTDYSQVGFAVILNAEQTITMKSNSGWQGCSVLQKSMINSAAWREYPTISQRGLLNLVGTFGGTAFAFSASDVTIRDTMIGGFKVGVNAHTSGTARLQMDHVTVDAIKCVLLDNSHDISRLSHVECFPLMTSGMAKAQTSLPISDISNNGAGLYRVTLPAGSTLPTTGDTVWIDQTVVGPQSVQGRRWKITTIDDTHFDLQGSIGTGSIAINGTAIIATKTISGVSSTTNLGVGQTCTGDGIPASTTITWISPNGTDFGISNAASVNGAIRLICNDKIYAAGGHVNWDAAFRDGVGMEFTNSEGDIGSDLFVFGHAIGYHLGSGMSWFSCTGCWSDGPMNPDIAIQQLLVDGTAKENSWVGGRLNGQICVNSSSGFSALTLTGVNIDATANNWVPLIEQDQGSATYLGNSATNGPSYFLFKTRIAGATVVGNNFGTGQLAFENSAAALKVNSIANTLNARAWAGYANFQNQYVKLGNQGGTCTATVGVGCPVVVGGPYADGVFSQQDVSSGSTVALSGNGHTTYFHATATLTTLTITLPSPVQVGGEFLFFFDQAVVTLKMNGVAQKGMPTTVAANTWYKCSAPTMSAFICGPG